MQSDSRRLLLALTGRLGFNVAMLAGLVAMLIANKPARTWRKGYGAQPLDQATPLREHGKYRLETAAADLFIAHFGTDPAIRLEIAYPDRGRVVPLKIVKLRLAAYPRWVTIDQQYRFRLTDAEFVRLEEAALETRSFGEDRVMLSNPAGGELRLWRLYLYDDNNLRWLVIAPAGTTTTQPGKGEQ